MPNDALATAARRIFVVEDEFLIRALIEDMLDDLGYALAGAAARLDDAARLARSIDCDLALLDVNLEGRDVSPVAQILDERGLPFFFVTGYGERGLPDAYRGRPTLHKPFQADDLGRMLSKMFAGK